MKNIRKIPIEQHDIIEHAQQRIKQKKRLYYHAVLFVLGMLFILIANKVIKIWEGWNWWLLALLVWGFLLTFHTVNVFITRPFLGKEWERKQREKLIAAEKAKIDEIQKDIDNE